MESRFYHRRSSSLRYPHVFLAGMPPKKNGAHVDAIPKQVAFAHCCPRKLFARQISSLPYV